MAFGGKIEFEEGTEKNSGWQTVVNLALERVRYGEITFFLSYDLVITSIRYIERSVIKIGINTVRNPYFFITRNLI